MHAPSIIQLAVTGLLAASAASGFQVTGPRDLARPLAGALVAYALPALASAESIEAREPHHKGRGKKAGAKRDEAAELETREPHHKGRGKKAGAKRAEDETADDVVEDDVDVEDEVDDEVDDEEEAGAEIEARAPHHKGRGKKAGARREIAARHHK
ncbi:hypothetical protein PFICI_03765 [Pestalotiopsis fici W106-1]|uniref:Uncharacterized protein n=1 Tax=Pestalotiopsis fici (strain W106-1 / CGMCC3.15140) TaxID=1229662 RepID=W3XIA2_PESFW|nr:uncharacterized protein PFICI_03765 [Pestalotiopsis fici W106-1]ETS85740.1 hypothetical protein PFICI_03765 [Pestalotiopsis fici W106-1]